MRKLQIVLTCSSLIAFIIFFGPTAQVTLAGASIQHQETSGYIQDADTGAGSITWDHTVGSGSDRILIVTTAIDSKSGSVVSAVSFDGNLLTRRTARNQGFEEDVQLWYMLDPPVGTFPVSVDYTGAYYGMEAWASTYTGVSQNRPISRVETAGGSVGPATVTIASIAGELVIDALGYNHVGTMAADTNQTERFNQSSVWNGAAASEKIGALSVTMSWNLENAGVWSLLAASLRPAQTPTVRTVTVKPTGGDYTSLNAAMAGEAADLVALNRQLNIELYAMTDTEAVDLVGPNYVTDPDHFIKVYTPASQRHAGAWDSDKYNLDAVAEIVAGGAIYPACFNIGEVDLWLDGIQAICSSASTNYPSMIAAGPGAAGAATLRVSNAIFKGNWIDSNNATNANFIITYDWPATSEMWVWNTIATDFWWADQTLGRGLHTTGVQGGEIWWSNVTLANLANAVSLDSATRLHVRNSLAQLPAGGASWPLGALPNPSESDYNASNLNEVLAGAHSLNNATFTFQGADDWRLAAADTGAQDNGVNSFNSFYVNDGKDVAGNTRGAPWDIGAGEYIDIAGVIPVTTAWPPGGAYASVQSVSLTTDVPATIYYTIDGSAPTTASLVYGGTIPILVDTTLKFFARNAAGNSEAVQTHDYIIDLIPPVTTAAPPGDTYFNPVDVTLTADEPATIYYTIDGSTPTTASAVYGGAIPMATTTTLKFFAMDAVGNNEAVATQVYTIVDITAPVTTASPAGGTYSGAISVTLTADEPATIYYTIDGGTPTTASTVYSGAISIAGTTTLQYFAVDTAGNIESVNSAMYTIQVPSAGDGSGGGSGCFISSSL